MGGDSRIYRLKDFEKKRKRNKTRRRKCVKKKKERQKKHDHNLSAILLKSIRINYIFYIALFVCFYMFKQSKTFYSSYFRMIFTFLVITIMGYFSHWISHNIHFKKLLYSLDNIFTRNKYIKKGIELGIDVFDFHHIIHHDTDINKNIMNIIIEFTSNLFIQGVAFALFIYLMDIRVILLWAFFYATVHIINYTFVKPTTHRDHHTDCRTNYGIDFTDIIFNTKYDLTDIEDHNHTAINLILISLVIMYFLP